MRGSSHFPRVRQVPPHPARNLILCFVSTGSAAPTSPRGERRVLAFLLIVRCHPREPDSCGANAGTIRNTSKAMMRVSLLHPTFGVETSRAWDQTSDARHSCDDFEVPLFARLPRGRLALFGDRGFAHHAEDLRFSIGARKSANNRRATAMSFQRALPHGSPRPTFFPSTPLSGIRADCKPPKCTQ